MAYVAPGGLPPSELLSDYARRLEFAQLAASYDRASSPGRTSGPGRGSKKREAKKTEARGRAAPAAPGLHLHPLQVFAERFMSPDTPVPRVLLAWDTGTGKSIAAITVGQKFVQRFRGMRQLEPADRPTVFVLGFTRQVIQAEMLRNPKHGFVTHQELAELRRLRDGADGSEPGSPESRRFNGYLGTLRRQLTDRTRGGYFRFYGYKEFANHMFVLTPKGERANFKVLELFLRPAATETTNKDDAPEAADDAPEAADDTPETAIEIFVQRIAAAEQEGLVRVNSELLQQLRRGLIIADEIHNVYNKRDSNMYGVALQFALDAFPPAEAPRALFMSATPLTGSPAEVVDLLNLLVPRADLPGGRPVARADLFTPAGDLRPGTLAEVTRLAAGRTTRLTVPAGASESEGAGSFPERVFLGDEVAGIPYLRFVSSELTPLHREALAAATAAGKLRPGVLPTPADYALYDMVFPDPEGGEPLYSSPAANPLREVYLRAPLDWRVARGVAVEPPPPSAGLRGPPAIGGSFLSLRWKGATGVTALSGKYTRWLRDVVARVKTRQPGKTLAYHNRIRGTGATLLAAALSQNGFVALGEPPVPTTLCSVCGAELKNHRATHEFRPARYGLLVGAMEASSRERSFGVFNAKNNYEGHEMRVLLGSEAVKEGLDFVDIRFEDLLSIPASIKILVQIVGRAVRRGGRPPGGAVEVSIYLYDGGAGPPPPTTARRRASGCSGTRA